MQPSCRSSRCLLLATVLHAASFSLVLTPCQRVGANALENDRDLAEESCEDQDVVANDENDMNEQGEMEIAFINDSPHAASLYWDTGEKFDLVLKSIPCCGGIQGMKSFPGHRFMLAKEGTRDRLGEFIVVQEGQYEYVLPENAKPLSQIVDCTDRDERSCARYAAQGECEKNPGWMIVNCPASCDACDLLDPRKRCARSYLNISDDHVWKPGDMNAMFERILKDYKDVYEITVLSQPPHGPWVLQFDNFLTDDQIETLVNWGYRSGFERSTDTGKKNSFGETTKIVSKSRTSENAWCIRECEEDPVVLSIMKRIEQVTDIPSSNYESFQVLKYQVGQEYKTHHDMAPADDLTPAGPRILTFFLYLSDVEDGGETDFPKLGLAVKPKRGRAILWPSVLDHSPLSREPLTEHAALPVKEGVKYAANAWIHSHNFRVANLYGCTGAFD